MPVLNPKNKQMQDFHPFHSFISLLQANRRYLCFYISGDVAFPTGASAIITTNIIIVIAATIILIPILIFIFFRSLLTF